MLGGSVEGPVAAGTLVRVAGRQSIILQERADYVPAEVGSIDHINLMIRAADIHEVAAYLREHDVDFVAANNKAPKLNPCSHLRSDPRFINDNICPAGSTVSEQFAILSPMPHEVQARTGAKIADVPAADMPLVEA